MEYLEYFKKYPDAYGKIVAGLDRSRTLHDYLEASGVLRGAASLLSIGPGGGEVEIRLANEIGLKLGVVEPSPLFFGQFETNVVEAGASERILEAHRQSFEDYAPSHEYDVVLSLFSWFAFGFDERILEKALSCLSPGGRLLICLQSERSPSTRISAASRSSGISLTSETLSRYYGGHGHAHVCDTYHGIVPAVRYIENGQLTEAGRDLVSFLTATPWDDMPEAARTAGLASLVGSVHDDVIDFEAGCLVFTRSA